MKTIWEELGKLGIKPLINSEKAAIIKEQKKVMVITNFARAQALKAMRNYTTEQMEELINNASESEIKKKPVFFIIAMEKFFPLMLL